MEDRDPDEVEVDALAAQASVVRSRLVHAFDTLERKREHVVEVGEQVKEGAGALAAVGAVLAAGGVAWLIYRAATARRRRMHDRWSLMQRAWRKPETLQPNDDVFAKLAKTLVSTIVPMLMKRLVAEMTQPRPSVANSRSPATSPAHDGSDVG